MSGMQTLQSLEHHFLIAMPNLANSWFDKALIYVVEDNDYGSMGLVVNYPHQLDVSQLLEHFDMPIPADADYLDNTVMMGGPVDMEHGFILHQPTGDWQKSLPLPDDLGMTVSEDFLKALSEQQGPQDFLVCLGFAGWEKGQLNEEIQGNHWLTIPYNASLLFDVPAEKKWDTAIRTLGISPEFLSMDAGHD